MATTPPPKKVTPVKPVKPMTTKGKTKPVAPVKPIAPIGKSTAATPVSTGGGGGVVDLSGGFQPTTIRERPTGMSGVAAGLQHAIVGAPAGIAGFIGEGAQSIYNVTRLPYDALTHQRIGAGHGSVKEQVEHTVPAPYHFAQSAKHTAERWTNPQMRASPDPLHAFRSYQQGYNEGTLTPMLIEDAANASMAFGAASRALGATSRVLDLTAAEAAAISGEPALAGASAGAATATAEAAPTGIRSIANTIAESSKEYLNRLPGFLREEARAPVTIEGKGLAGYLERAAGEGAVPETSRLLRAAQTAERVGGVMRVVGTLGEQVGNAPILPWQKGMEFVGRGADFVNPAVGAGFADLPKLGPGEKSPGVGGLLSEGFQRATERLTGSESNAGQRLGNAMWRWTPEGREFLRDNADIERRTVEAQRAALAPARIVTESVDRGYLTPEQGELAGRLALFNVDRKLDGVLASIAGHENDPVFMAHFADVVKEMYREVEPGLRPTIEDVINVRAYRAGQLPDNVTQVAKAAEDAQRNLSAVRQDIVTGQEQWQKVAADPTIPGSQEQWVRVDNGTGAAVENPIHPEQLGQELMPHVVYENQQRAEVLRKRQERAWEHDSNTFYRDQRVADAYKALNDQIPAGPTQRETRAAGQFAGQQKAERVEYRKRQVELNNAINDYVRLSEGGPSAAMVEALNRLDKAEAALLDQREKVTRLEGRVDTTAALGRASGDIEEGPPRLPGEHPDQYATRLAEWKVEQSLARLEALNEQYGFSQSPRPEVTVEGQVGRTEARDIRDHVDKIKTEQARQVSAEIDQITAGDRPSLPDKGAAGGEYDWWYELDDATRRRLQREGWLKGRTQPRKNPVTGAIEREDVPVVTPDAIADAMDNALGTHMTTDEAMARYVDTIRRYWESKARKTSDTVIEQAASELGLPRDRVNEAVNGRIGEYGDLLASDANAAIDELGDAVKSLSPEEMDAFSSYFDTMRQEDGGAISLDNLEQLLNSFFPHLDVGSQEGLLAAVYDRADIDALGDWLRGGTKTEFPTQLRAKIEQLGPAQYTQRGRLAGEITGERRVTRSLEARYREAMGAVDKAEAQGAKAQAAAEQRMNTAQDKLEEHTPIAGPVKPSAGPRPHERRQWYDSDGVLHQAEMSPAERARYAQGRADLRAAQSEARMNRSRQALDRTQQKIAEMPQELARSLQTRMVEDVNARGVRSMMNAVRSGGARLGTIIGRGDTVSLTGMLGRMAKKYHIYDELVTVLTDMQNDIRSGAGHYEEYAPGGVQGIDPMLRAYDMADAFEHVLHESGQMLDHIDNVAWNDSKHADILLQEIDDIMGDNQGALAYNAPFRVMDVINAYGDWHMPAEAEVKVRAAYDRYHQARVKFLGQSMDEHARAIPAVYREIHQVGRREFAALVDKAEGMNINKPGAGDVFLEVAESIPSTLQMIVDADIQPVHLIGGPAERTGGSAAGRGRARSARTGQRNTGINTLSRSDLRELSIEAYAKVEARRAETIALNQRDKWILQRYGVRADEIPGVQALAAEHRAATGERLTPGQIDKAARDAGYVPFTANTTVGPQTMYIRKQIKHALDPTPWGGPIFTGLRWANQKFKSWVLAASTRWLTGNVFGNIIQAYANAGVGPVTLLRQMNNVAKAMGGWKKAWEHEGVYEGAPAQLTQHGLTSTEFRLRWGDTAKDPRTPIGRGLRLSYKLNEFVDNMTRNAVYFTKLKEGVPREAAMETVLRSLGDYTRMSKFERDVVREILPFYAWLRHSTMAAFRLPITSPTRAAFMLNLSNIYTDPDELDSVLRFMGTKIPLVGNKMLDIGGSFSPYPEMSQEEFSPFDPRAAFGQTTPVAKGLFQAMTGLDLNQLKESSRPADTRNRNPFGSDDATPAFSRILHGDVLAGFKEMAWQASQNAPTQIRAARDLGLTLAYGPGKRYSGTGAPYEGIDPNKGVNTLILKMLGLPYVYTLPREDLEAGAQKGGR